MTSAPYHWRVLVAGIGLHLLGGPSALAGQTAVRATPMARAFEQERLGNYSQAAAAYRAVLAERPADLGALLGLERVLLPLNRPEEILPQVRAALIATPRSAPLYGLALRAWSAADEPDSMRTVAERWAAFAEDDETPYREWGAAALARRDRAGARAAYVEGRQQLKRPDAMAAELAQLAGADGDYAGALGEWVLAVARFPGYRSAASAAIAPAPEQLRPALLDQLRRTGGAVAGGLEADLRSHWGDPLGGYSALEATLPADRIRAIEALRGFIDAVRPLRTRAASRARGRALEAIASRSIGPQVARARLDAARAYADGGDRESARRMLAGVAGDGSRSPAESSEAGSALIEVLIGERKMADAEAAVARLRPPLGADQSAAVRRRIADGWIRAGNLDRAAATIGADSSVDGLAISGRIQLYRGDLSGALTRLRDAGPYAGARMQATRRTTLLALLQSIETDTLPALGAALLRLEEGDTAAGIIALERVAQELEPSRGGAELRLLAGHTAATAGHRADAERLYKAAAVRDAPATAPAAALALAELYLSTGRPRDAVATLEHLILTWPESALVPQARRRLDEAHGAVPHT